MDNDLIRYRNEQKEMIELIDLTAKFNNHMLTEKEHDRLDHLILANDFNMRMFEMLTDQSFRQSLQNIVDSL